MCTSAIERITKPQTKSRSLPVLPEVLKISGNVLHLPLVADAAEVQLTCVLTAGADTEIDVYKIYEKRNLMPMVIRTTH